MFAKLLKLIRTNHKLVDVIATGLSFTGLIVTVLLVGNVSARKSELTSASAKALSLMNHDNVSQDLIFARYTMDVILSRIGDNSAQAAPEGHVHTNRVIRSLDDIEFRESRVRQLASFAEGVAEMAHVVGEPDLIRRADITSKAIAEMRDKMDGRTNAFIDSSTVNYLPELLPTEEYTALNCALTAYKQDFDQLFSSHDNLMMETTAINVAIEAAANSQLQHLSRRQTFYTSVTVGLTMLAGWLALYSKYQAYRDHAPPDRRQKTIHGYPAINRRLIARKSRRTSRQQS